MRHGKPGRALTCNKILAFIANENGEKSEASKSPIDWKQKSARFLPRIFQTSSKGGRLFATLEVTAADPLQVGSQAIQAG